MRAARVERVGDGPIIDASTCASIGTNIGGPSLVRVPDWVAEPLGRYYLYFADHKGTYIRLAYADRVEGPWSVHRPGSLHLADSTFPTQAPKHTPEDLAQIHARWRAEYGGDYSADEVLVDATTPHIASPDVHLDDQARRFVMYFHGLEAFGRQSTRVATSTDGIDFVAEPATLGRSYFRVFRYQGWFYALVMPGQLMRSRDWVGPFEPGPLLFEPDMRHSAVRVDGDRLTVFWSRVGDCPESILESTIDMGGAWHDWSESEATVVLGPETRWEGAAQPLEPSRRGAVHGLANQLRDPCVFQDDGATGAATYLLYACGGESAIALARLARRSGRGWRPRTIARRPNLTNPGA